jgi:U4/U6.U5 tri-snRNP-associated protein 3
MRDRPRERSRDRDRNRDDERRRSRSRSPRREREREREREQERERERDVDREGKTNRDGERKPEKTKPEFAESFSKNRAATPPVSFKVGGAPPPQEHDRMDMDGTSTGSKGRAKGGKKPREEEPAEEDEDIVVEDDGMAAMQAMMGFGGFGTTHQKKVAGNDIYAVRKEKKTEYRQYMNRVGGFNRPLSPSRD